MTVATNAAAPQRRVAPTARTSPAAPAMRTSSPAAPTERFDEDEPEFRLDLRDIPQMRESMDVDGLKPTLLSRLFDLVAPIRA